MNYKYKKKLYIVQIEGVKIRAVLHKKRAEGAGEGNLNPLMTGIVGKGWGANIVLFLLQHKECSDQKVSK